MKNTVNTMGIPKAEVLAALYNHARSGILGALWAWLDPEGTEEMSADDAEELINDTPDLYFDYIGVKCLKVDLSDDYGFDPRLYDRDNGIGAAESAVAPLRKVYAACA